MADAKPIRVILVEDNEHDALAVRRVLEGQEADSFRIDHVERGEAALEILQTGGDDVDLVLLDYNLPGMNGLEVGVELMALSPDTPLVLLTGEGSETLAVQALKAGIHDYVVKDPRAGYLTILPIKLREVVQRAGRDRDLRESRERYARLVETIPGIIYCRSMARGLLYISGKVEDLLGFDREALLGDVTSWFEAVHPDDASTVEAVVADAGQGRHFDVEYRIRHGEHEWKWVHDRSFNIMANGGDVEVEGLVMDITREKRLEELKEDFIRVSRHDMRSPLSGIISLSSMMAEDMEGDCATYSAAILKSAYRMMDMLNSTVDMHKMEQGVLHMDIRKVDIDRIVQEVVQHLTSLAEFSGRIIRTNRCGASVWADETLLWSVLANLVKNGLEAGGREDEVSLACAAAGPEVFVEVRNLQPVPREMRDHFFEKYYTQGKKYGYGLGCYSAKLMTELMGGTITMRTSEEDGTTVRVSLKAV